MMKKLYVLALVLGVSQAVNAQFDIEGKIKRKVNQRVDQKIDQTIDKTLDKTEEGVKDAAKGDKKSKTSKTEGEKNVDSDNSGETRSSNESQSAGKSEAKAPAFKTYSSYDFVAGEKILVSDDFSNVSIGDFPADWNSNTSGEVVNVEGHEGKWFMFAKEGVFMPDYINDLPENFTLTFDVMVNEDFDYYSGFLAMTFMPTENRNKLSDFRRFSSHNSGVRLSFHPTDAGNGKSRIRFCNWDVDGTSLMDNEVDSKQFCTPKNSKARVSIWRQNQRLRVYLNEEKIYDVPRAFSKGVKYNALSFCYEGQHRDNDVYLIGNVELAVGAPDTRSKLITEGKLVTRGILFDSNSDKIKPESYGTLKDIAAVLKENPDVKVKIIGHTDSDGDDAKNLDLSKRRAASVKETLVKEFAIADNRMETDGKGESEPTDKNDTSSGKANNRRVEFVKL
jgi:OOP family OmpA-OmpF porin